MKITTNVEKILKEYLIGKTILNIHVEEADPNYGYMYHPVNNTSKIIHYDGDIVDVKINLPDYETGSITVFAKPGPENTPIEINVSWEDFELMF